MPANQPMCLVDPDPSLSRTLTALLGGYGIPLRAFADAEQCLTALQNGHPRYRCMLINAELPGARGLTLLQRLGAEPPPGPLFLMTPRGDRALRQQAFDNGATDVLEKPLVYSFLAEMLTYLYPDHEDAAAAEGNTGLLIDGQHVRFRAVRPEDGQMQQDFVRNLSQSSRQLRFFSSMEELPPAMLHDFTHPNYPDSYAIVATVHVDGAEQQVGVARYFRAQQPGSVEFAVVVADAWHGHGVASKLLRGITIVAAVAGMRQIEGLVLRENQPMLELAAYLGFKVASGSGDPAITRVVKRFANGPA